MPELTHPDLPGVTYVCHEAAALVHELAGWLRHEDAPAEPVTDEQPGTLLDLSKKEK